MKESIKQVCTHLKERALLNSSNRAEKLNCSLTIRRFMATAYSVLAKGWKSGAPPLLKIPFSFDMVVRM